MSTMKRVLKHPRTQTAISWLLAQYIRLVYYTSVKTRLFDEASLPYLKGEKNAIFAFWHGRLMLCLFMEPPNRQMHVLSSAHRDGVLISKVISFFGEATITGSSSKGGSDAVRKMLHVLKAGDNACITPDGPRGPRYVAEKGVVTLARISGKPIIPISFSSTRHRTLRSWDHFMLALPFGRIVFCVGAPISVSKDADDHAQEQARLMIEKTMIALVEKTDSITNARNPNA